MKPLDRFRELTPVTKHLNSFIIEVKLSTVFIGSKPW